ncbi:MAG: DNA repair protein RecO [Pseudohongiellaceae bacterium]
MDTRVTLQPAYVLHRRPFQNTSLLVDFFTLDYGRVRAVARGARREKSRHRALLQLFTPVLLSCSGRGEVKTLNNIESQVAAITLHGERLFSGLYLNELLVRLLHQHVEHTELYQAYQTALLSLQGDTGIEQILRHFELQLLGELGYGLNLQTDCYSQLAICAGQLYRFEPEIGFSAANDDAAGVADDPWLFAGEHLIALSRLELDEASVAHAAKRLLRLALHPHLGDKPLASRSLFTARG